MKLYFAPMEGITGWIFRQALHDHFGEGIDSFFSPFIVPHEKRALTTRDIENIKPEHNRGFRLVPQVLTNSVSGYLSLEREIAELGYDEVNLNIGCPSKTVTSKGRGSGFLRKPEELDAFLEGVYNNARLKVSVKTRIGYESAEEWEELLAIYNKYPICELTVHPRTGIQMYQGNVDMEAFLYAVEEAKMPLCYNGDICTEGDYKERIKRIEETDCGREHRVESVMIGRGVLSNPALFREIAGGKGAEAGEIQAFLQQIEEGYEQVMANETQILFKLKEIWNFLQVQFPDREREMKKIRKCKNMREYRQICQGLFLS